MVVFNLLLRTGIAARGQPQVSDASRPLWCGCADRVHDREYLRNPSGFNEDAVRDSSVVLSDIRADILALYLKSNNYHWHMSGPHFRDNHLLLDDQSDQILAVTDLFAQRVREIGGYTLRSIGHIARQQRVRDNNAD